MRKSSLFPALPCLLMAAAPTVAQDIVHDAEYYVLQRQNAERWAADDRAVDQRLAEYRRRHGGKAPNILYILVDDVGFGELGSEVLNHVRGYETPHINDFAEQSMRFSRMYTEPSCTPTRVAFMTGRQPYRMGMAETAVAISGFGLPGSEVTLAELLSEAGYNTVHIGKWHMGDVMEAWPNHQGFDFAAFPIHQQAQLALFSKESHDAVQMIGRDKRSYDDKFTLDHTLRPVPGDWVTGVEGARGQTVREVDLEPGEEWTQQKYREMNERYQRQTLEHLRKLADQDEPFFLQYWPLLPLTFTRSDVDQFTTPNGGTQTESMQELDGWIGDILTEVDRLGIADETLVVIMGDNGNFTKYQPYSGYSPMIYKGGKGDYYEGGVRVDAFARWPGMIAADSVVGDMIHVADLYTSLARIAGAADRIPRDRLVDGVDQTAMMLVGETHGRRDHVFIYQGPVPRAIVKEQYKLHIPGPGENLVVASFYDLFRDPREEKPVSTQVGAWAAETFGACIKRHLAMKQKYPDTPPAYGRPYDGVEDLRPETVRAVEAFLANKPGVAPP